ncbi:MAG: class I SAM-dependent methyltransferase [Candidatus Latescibacterota bacterium]|nr:MAG: class I SAM-dependent methyltransferase [Candidatus Latescibacterota bacterium]
MGDQRRRSDFPERTEENGRIWDANARWWDDRIGDGNDFQTLLIEPATERLLAVSGGDVILDIACGAGRLARRLAERGARVVAFDQSERFIARARERTPRDAAVEYRVLDAADEGALLSLGAGRFDKAVCTMALMDMPVIEPMLSALTRLLKSGGVFVFSITHPCFHSSEARRFAEVFEDEAGRHGVRTGVKVTLYRTPFARKTEGIIGQPEAQYYFHRPIHALFGSCFASGFVVDGLEEPGLPAPGERRAAAGWEDMPEIPPILVVRTRLEAGGRPATGTGGGGHAPRS